GGIAAGDQAQHGPSGLGGRAVGGSVGPVIVAGAAFAPASIGVLDRAEPLAGSQDIRLTIAFARGLQSPQRQVGPVDVIDAPAAIPASVVFLDAFEERHSAPYGLMAVGNAARRKSLQNAGGDVRTGAIEHGVMIGERHATQEIPVVIDVES